MSEIHGFELNPSYNTLQIADTDEISLLEFFKWWYNCRGIECQILHVSDWMLSHGFIDILNWYTGVLNDHGIEFKYEPLYLIHKPLDTLNWLYHKHVNNGWEFKYEDNMLTDWLQFSANKMFDVLNWLWDRRDTIGFKYDEAFLSRMESANTKVLTWFWDHHINDELEFKYNSESLNYACRCGDNFDVLDFWYDRRHQLELKYDCTVLTFAHKSIDVWNYWYNRKHDLEFKYCRTIIDQTLQFEYTYDRTDGVIIHDQNHSTDLKIAKLRWWLDRKDEFEFQYSPYVLEYASCNDNCNEIFDYWLDNLSEYPLKINYDIIVDMIKYVNDFGRMRFKWILKNIDRITVEGDMDAIKLLLEFGFTEAQQYF
jgi:hypothetical protein